VERALIDFETINKTNNNNIYIALIYLLADLELIPRIFNYRQLSCVIIFIFIFVYCASGWSSQVLKTQGMIENLPY